MRHDAPLYADAEFATHIGKVTSGAFGPTVGGPVAMGYVATNDSQIGHTVFAELRGRSVPSVISALPFVPAHFKR